MDQRGLGNLKDLRVGSEAPPACPIPSGPWRAVGKKTPGQRRRLALYVPSGGQKQQLFFLPFLLGFSVFAAV